MPNDFTEQLQALLPPGKAGKAFGITKLMGDASYREYYRLSFSKGSSRTAPTLIVMKLPVGASSKAEEITKTKKQFDELPFINVQRYLASISLPVPELVGYSKEAGVLLLSDLGDQTLYEGIQKNKDGILSCYERAITLLQEMQTQTLAKPSQDCVASWRHFDADLLNWEFDHFLEYGLGDRLKIKVGEEDRQTFTATTRSISQKITQMSQGFVHRDFQSRNLMIHAEKLWLIDFQDALTGPILYDLVALLRDSYVSLDAAQVDSLQRFYEKGLAATHPYKGQLEKLRKDFDLITLQRKLKDTGRFQYIYTVKGNSSFLKYVGPSLSYVREALGRCPEYGNLKSVIEKYLPGFGAC